MRFEDPKFYTTTPMKHCPYCGKEYPDDVELCATDNNRLVSEQPKVTQPAPSPAVLRPDEISPEEQRFWERMTFRQFAILIIRLQAVWLFYYAALESIYILRYAIRLSDASSYSAAAIKQDIFWVVLGVIIRIAAGVWLIQKGERLLSWLVKDDIAPPQAKPQ